MTFGNEKLIFDYRNFHIEFSYLLYIDKTKELIHKFKFLGQLLNEDYFIAIQRLSIETGLQERGRNARNIWQNTGSGTKCEKHLAKFSIICCNIP